MRLEAKRGASANGPALGWRALAGLCLVLAAGCGEAPLRPVLLVTIDTLRADHLSAYGYGRPTSPSIEALAARGVRFVNAFSASSCTAPSHASILTGLYPSFHSIGPFNFGHLQPEDETLAERLQAGGYRTAAIVSNPVLGAKLGLDQGFEHYDDRLEGEELNRQLGERYSDRAVDLALERLKAFGAPPWFLWLHLQDPHGPYAPRPGWDCSVLDGETEGGTPPAAASLPATPLPVGGDQAGYQEIPAYQVFGEERTPAEYARRYDCEIAFMDHHLGRVLEWVERERPETLVLLTADHGEAFGEDGFYFAHGHSVGLDQVRVPLVIAGAGIPEGVVVERAASNVAIFSTVLDALGLAGPTSGPDQVESLLAGRSDRAGPGGGERPAPVFVESINQVGVAAGGHFLRRDRLAPTAPVWVRNPNTGGFWKALGPQMVGLAGGGSTPAAGELALMDSALTAWDLSARRSWSVLAGRSRQEALSPERERAIRALGYVQ